MTPELDTPAEIHPVVTKKPRGRPKGSGKKAPKKLVKKATAPGEKTWNRGRKKLSDEEKLERKLAREKRRKEAADANLNGYSLLTLNRGDNKREIKPAKSYDYDFIAERAENREHDGRGQWRRHKSGGSAAGKSTDDDNPTLNPPIMKKRRGRKPGTIFGSYKKTILKRTAEILSDQGGEVVKRKRGRPSKSETAAINQTKQENSINYSEAQLEKLLANALAQSLTEIGAEGVTKPSGSSTSKASQPAELTQPPAKKRGRPKLSENINSLSLNLIMQPTLKLPKSTSGKPRGRPARILTPEEIEARKALNRARARARYVPTGRPRGRRRLDEMDGEPRPKPKFVSSGRPRGRPRKAEKPNFNEILEA